MNSKKSKKKSATKKMVYRPDTKKSGRGNKGSKTGVSSKYLQNAKKNKKTTTQKNKMNDLIIEVCNNYDNTPTKFPLPVIIKAVYDGYGIVMHVSERLKVCRKTIYRWIENFPEVKEAFDDAAEQNVDIAEDTLVWNMQNRKDVTSAIFVCKTKGQSRGYVEKRQIDLSGNVNIKIGKPVLNEVITNGKDIEEIV